MTEINAGHRQEARRMAEGVSALLTDEQRENAIRAGAVVAEGLQDSIESPLGALRMAATISRMFGELATMRVSDLSSTVTAYIDTYAMATGIIAGVIGAPAEAAVEPEPAPTPPSDVRLVGPYL
jgi:hypothetical protein